MARLDASGREHAGLRSFQGDAPDRVPRSQPGAPLIFASVALLTLASRLPFLGAGYGTDWDAWRMAAASREIAATGVYVASRLPGHPVPELLGALLRSGGPLALNGVVALASALAAGLFALSWRALGGRSPIAAGLALAFTPVVFIHSVDAMDHVWALAFLMAALFSAISRRPLAAGMALGLAIGCRPGSLWILPTLIWLAARKRDGLPRWRDATRLTLSAGFVGALLFLPVFDRYGWGFLTFYDSVSPSPGVIAKRATLDVWGAIGALALCGLALARALGERGRGRAGPQAAWGLAVAVCGVAYLRLPHDAGYWIPAVPFVLLLLAGPLSSWPIRANAAALFASCLFLSVTSEAHVSQAGGPRFFPFSDAAWRIDLPGGSSASGGSNRSNGSGERLVIDPLAGPLLLDSRRRRADVAYAHEVLARLRALAPPSSTVLAGERHLHLRELASDAERDAWHFVDGLDGESLASLASRGTPVYWLPEQREANLRVYGADPQRYGAQPLLE